MIAISSTWNIERGDVRQVSGEPELFLRRRASRPPRNPVLPAYSPSADRGARGVRRGYVLSMVRQYTSRGQRVAVSDIAAALGVTPGSVSWHLNKLAKAGLVRSVAYGDWRAVEAATETAP